MAAPTVASVSSLTGTGAVGTNLTNIQANMPSGITAGDLLLLVVGNDVGVDDMTATNFTELYDTRQGTTQRFAAYARIADGSANDSSVVSGDNQDYVIVTLRITNHGVVTILSDLVLPAMATNTSATPDPPASGTQAAKDWLAVCAFGADFTNAAWTVNSQPSTYTSHGLTKSASSTTSHGFGIASKQLTNATSEDPGTFGISNSTLWQAITILVPPYAGGPVPVASAGARIAFGTETKAPLSLTLAIASPGARVAFGTETKAPLSLALPIASSGARVAFGTETKAPVTVDRGIAALSGTAMQAHASLDVTGAGGPEPLEALSAITVDAHAAVAMAVALEGSG